LGPGPPRQGALPPDTPRNGGIGGKPELRQAKARAKEAKAREQPEQEARAKVRELRELRQAK